jgi:glucan-binding YG repeat protein
MIKNIRKRILSLIMIAGIMLGISVPAQAEWQKGDNGWNYYENGTLKKGWVQDNGNWYFFNKDGNMLTGWVIDNGAWYYMREDGSLNDSKTTKTIPSEIQSIINIVNPFAGGLKLTYAGRGYVKNTDVFSNYGLADKWVVILKANNEYGDNTDFYYVYDPYNCKIFKLYDNLTIEYLGQGNKTNSISPEQAIQNIKNYLSENNKNIPSKIVIEQEENNAYLVHCYDDMGDHTATVGWYYIDKSTDEIIKM